MYYWLLQILSSLDLDGIVEFMKSDKCQNIITMAGAGISTSAGASSRFQSMQNTSLLAYEEVW